MFNSTNKRQTGSNPPIEFRSNFNHLYMDIGWFGVLSGSALNFINVYATRIGATGVQIGLVGGMSAIISLLFAIPAGKWLENKPTGRAVFWASVLYRIGFIFFILIPWFGKPQSQIWILIILSLIMGIPLVALSVGFGALFAESVPSEWRAHVAAVRNIILSITFMVSSLVSGFILDHLPFPINYQVVFLIGFFGAAMSSLHLFFVKPVERQDLDTKQPPLKKEKDSLFHLDTLRLDIWKTPYKTVLIVMMIFHFTQYLAIPVFPIFFVRALNLNDQELGIGTALFYFAVLLGSTQLSRFVRDKGNKTITGWGVTGLAFYPILLAISTHVWHYYLISIVGGLVWAFAGGSSPNYLLEKCPENDRPSHLAWYNIILNASILIGSLLGPFLADHISLQGALILFGIARGMAGIAILKWG
jgi:MFS family permease